MEKFKKIIPMIIGILLIAGAVFFYFRAGELTKVCTEKSTATVVNMREETDYTSDTLRYIYYPVIRYDANGRTIEKELGSGSGSPAYSINDNLEILYNPNNVEEFIVIGENQNFTWILLSVLGITFFGVGIYSLAKK